MGNIKNYLLYLLILLVSTSGYAQSCVGSQGHLTLTDKWGRTLNEREISLVDWQGHVHNPYISLIIQGDDQLNYPVTVTVTAEGSSRLMLDLPSTLSAAGAQKTISLSGPNSPVSVLLEIAPDRIGGYDEVETYSFKLAYNGISQCVPIKVLDRDDDLVPSTNLVFDYRYAYDRTQNFNIPGFAEATEQGVKDWFYFFDYDNFDTVPAGEEVINLVGNDWEYLGNISNDTSYDGYYVFVNSIASPHSTGYPSFTNEYLKIDGQTLPGPLHRSSALVMHLYEDAVPLTSLADDEWYKTDPYLTTDIYGVSVHEIGHGIAYEDSWQGMTEYKNNYERATKVIDYQGLPVPISEGHIPDEPAYWDRISGQSAAWTALFPVRRWMLTKLALLIAQEVGWPLREIGPFLDYKIITQSLPSTVLCDGFSQTLESNLGGVPFYNWSVHSGVLPEGLELNSFTGEISGIPTKVGTFEFEVKLEDYDDLSTPKYRSYTIDVEGSECATSSTQDEEIGAELSIYPNPVSDLLSIQLTGSKALELTIADPSGKTVFRSMLRGSQKVDLSEFPTGAYILSFRRDGKVFTKQIIRR